MRPLCHAVCCFARHNPLCTILCTKVVQILMLFPSSTDLCVCVFSGESSVSAPTTSQCRQHSSWSVQLGKSGLRTRIIVDVAQQLYLIYAPAHPATSFLPEQHVWVCLMLPYGLQLICIQVRFMYLCRQWTMKINTTLSWELMSVSVCSR